MKLNKKGFTLIELLAVIVLLLAISAMAISSISAAIERNKKKQNDAKIKVLESYAELYYQEHKNDILVSRKKCIYINDLKEAAHLTDNEVTDANDKQFSGGINFNDGKNFKYESSLSDCN